MGPGAHGLKSRHCDQTPNHRETFYSHGELEIASAKVARLCATVARATPHGRALVNDPRVRGVTTDKRNAGDARRCRVRRPCSTETTMNLSKLSQIIFVGVCAGSFICGDANGQISGTGTTGSTAGGGLGNGSAGVMTGTGPDPLNTSTPYEQTITERMIVMPNSQRKKGAKVRKRSKKLGSKPSTTQNPPAAAATAAPSPR